MRRHEEEHIERKSNYSKSYKREAVAEAEANGNVSQTARQLGISNKSLHDWIKQYGAALDMDSASVKELSACVRQLAMRERQSDVLKKPSGSSAKPRRTVCDDLVRSAAPPERLLLTKTMGRPLSKIPYQIHSQAS